MASVFSKIQIALKPNVGLCLVLIIKALKMLTLTLGKGGRLAIHCYMFLVYGKISHRLVTI